MIFICDARRATISYAWIWSSNFLKDVEKFPIVLKLCQNMFLKKLYKHGNNMLAKHAWTTLNFASLTLSLSLIHNLQRLCEIYVKESQIHLIFPIILCFGFGIIMTYLSSNEKFRPFMLISMIAQRIVIFSI